MPERILFPEFRDELEFTKYPFTDSATLQSTDGQAIEEDTFLDASLYIVGATSQLHITSITVAFRAVVIWFGDRITKNLASASFDPLDPPALLEVVDAYGRPAGVLVSEPIRLARFSVWASGTHTFQVQATEFVASCVIPMPGTGVRGLLDDAGRLFAGDVWLVGDNGVVVREDEACVVRVDIVGDPLFVRRICDPLALFNTPNFVRTINDCGPDEFGDFKIVPGNHLAADTVLRVNPTDDGLRIEAVGELVRTNT